MHFCSNCGEQVNDECRFCQECGALQSGRNHVNKIKHKEMRKKNTTNKVWYNSKTIPINIKTHKTIFKKAIENPISVGVIIGLIIIIMTLAKSYF